MSDEPPFRAIAESTYDLETWVDETGTVRWVNRAAARFLGIDVAACLAMPDFPLPLVHPEDRGIVADVTARASRGESGSDIEFRIVARGGAPRWVSVSFQPLVDDDGRPRGYRTSVRDIEVRKESERRLAEAERAAARVAAERTQLLATLSHELRTPIHCIAGYAELLLDSSDPERARRFLGVIADQSSGALRLVEDLLHFAAGSARESSLRMTRFDAEALVSAQVEALRSRAGDGVDVRFDGSLAARRMRLGDADRVRQIVANLVSNALRFTERGSVRVAIAECSVPPGPEHLAIRVEDTGIGMAPEILDRVRRPYVQAEPRGVSSRGGVGLGLAIVDDLLSRLGGQLSIESAPGAGTIATATLRLPFVGEADVAADRIATASRRGLSVLVVDDVAASRELLSAMFESLGIAAEVAASGEKALEACARRMPDVVVVDYHMPGLDGLETARRIVAAAPMGAARPYVVMLTADVLADGLHPEVDAWHTKPMRRDELVALVERASTRDLGSEPELDPRPMDDLDAIMDASGRSILHRKGAQMLEALLDARTRILEAVDDRRRGEAAHELIGLSASLGARGLERIARRIEADPGDAHSVADLERAIDPAQRAIRARLAASRSSA